MGKGQCPLCHAFHKGMLGERAPNLQGLPGRAGKERLEDPKYNKGKPEARDFAQKEAFPGSGTAENGQEYIAESHSCPSCYVVAGYGVKGTNDKESPMPAIHKPPISLSLPELAAVDTWLYVREGVMHRHTKRLLNRMKSLFLKRIGLNSKKISQARGKRSDGGWNGASRSDFRKRPMRGLPHDSWYSRGKGDDWSCA